MTNENSTKRNYEFRRLEDLDLIDNFLFQQMLSQEGKDSETFARILLKTILGRHIRHVTIVPQKNILGIDTNKHGIRLDAYIQEVPDEQDPNLADVKLIPSIYDIEPNKTFDKESLPKRVRYYHGLIDTQLLSTGASYSLLPNVVIIVILPYDPFDKNRMVYTIKNGCEEDPTVPYEDGARKIFLYTKGTKGNPSQALRDMLKYIEKSTADNVTNQDIASISLLVDKVKHKKEVSISYMKSWEYEKWVHDEAYKNGYEGGYGEGHSDGYNDGHNDGYNDGRNDGYNDGRNDGAAQINQLNILLAKAGRTDDIIKAAIDDTYREELLKEFHLV